MTRDTRRKFLKHASAGAAAVSLPLTPRQASPAGASVTIENFVFTPARLVVHKGDAVTFVNNDILLRRYIRLA